MAERDVRAELEAAIHASLLRAAKPAPMGSLEPGDQLLHEGEFVEVERISPVPRRGGRRQVQIRGESGASWVGDWGYLVKVVRHVEQAREVPTPPLAEVLARHDVETRRAS